METHQAATDHSLKNPVCSLPLGQPSVVCLSQPLWLHGRPACGDSLERALQWKVGALLEVLSWLQLSGLFLCSESFFLTKALWTVFPGPNPSFG